MAEPRKMENLCFQNPETNETYNILVSSEDAVKAYKDLHFATMLYEQAKKFKEQPTSQIINDEASTSSSSSEYLTSTKKTDVECIEDKYIWKRDETMLLLQTYSEHENEFHNGKKTAKQYWEKIAKIMQEKGYNVTGFKCSTKFQALKRQYKCILDHNKKSGNNRKEWEYFKIMQELFEKKPWVQPLAVAGSHLETEEKEKEKENIPEKGNKKKKMKTFVEDYILQSREERRNQRDIRAKQHEEKMLSIKRIESLMERILEQEKK